MMRKNDKYSSRSMRPAKLTPPKGAPAQPLPEAPAEKPEDAGMRLNKYVAHCGLCSRRQAIDYVKAGAVTVNGAVVTEPGYCVQEADVVAYKGQVIKPEATQVYILMNKPKGVLTTVKDDRGRKTVIDLLGGKVGERVFPVGRLDLDTTGLLLLTNDGDLSKRLMHPSHKVKKFYHAVLDRPVSPEHLASIRAGVTLEDGLALVDSVDYLQSKDKNEIGIELHIGKNRIVRRIFEHFGYRVERLDRLSLGGLTKKNLPRGWWRHLTQQEVILLKHFS